MMKRVLYILISMMLVMPLYAADIQYEGSSTIGKYISDAAVVYEPATFSVDDSGESLGGELCAAAGKCQLGGVARAVRQEILDQGVNAVVIGKDAISVIVNVRNPVTNLSRAQLRAIFTGRIKNWREVGGPDRPIRPYIVRDASATRHVFREAILPNEQYARTAIAKPDRKVVAKVVHDWGAIGQISFAFIKDIKGVKPVSVEEQEARVDNPNYPITRPLMLVTKGGPDPVVKAFIDWTLSAEGQDVVRKRFVGVH